LGRLPDADPDPDRKAKEAAAAAVAKVAEANAAADAGDPSAEQIAAEAGEFAAQVRTHYAAIEEAKRRCEWMERTIEDQLVESDYVAECRDVIEDGCKLGTGILKGPTTVQSLRPKWSEVPVVIAGQPTAEKTTGRCSRTPTRGRCSSGSTRGSSIPICRRPIKEAEFTFELSLPSRKDLKRSARKLGFNKEAVTRLLEEGPPHRSIPSSSTSPKSARSPARTRTSGRYVQWEYNGPLECDEICGLLRAMGRDEEAAGSKPSDPFEEYRVIIWFIGNEVLKIAPEYPLDSGDGLYSVWCFEKRGIDLRHRRARDLSDSQDELNNAWRMMQDNGALSVGPQLVFDKGAVIPQDGTGG
jgi:hypothetical protein